MSTKKIAEYVKQLQAAQADLVAAVEAASEKSLATAPAEDEWSAAQVVGHVAELQPFWLKKARSLSTAHPEPLSRTIEEHESRDIAVDVATRRTKDALVASLRTSNKAALEILKGMDDDALKRSGPRWGGEIATADQVISTYVVGHVVQHAEQLKQALSTPTATT